MHYLREDIETTAPKAEEGISWNELTYKYFGILTGFDIAKQHVSS